MTRNDRIATAGWNWSDLAFYAIAAAGFWLALS